MKVTILGTANAWGVNEFTFTPPTPKRLTGTLSDGTTEVEIRRYRTSLLVETHDGKKVLIDCGPDFAHQRRHFHFGVVDYIFITHPHLDHIGGLDELNIYRPTSGLPIPTHATPECWRCITANRGFDYIEQIGLVTHVPLKPTAKVPAEREIKIGNHLTVTPFSVEHHFIAPGAVGFALEEMVDGATKRLLYTGDLWAVSNPSDGLFRKTYDVLVMECDRFDGLAGPSVGGGHMSFEEAMRCLKSGVFSHPQPNQVVFVHFGDNGPNGPTSTYQQWRDAIICALRNNGLVAVMPCEDHVIAYERLSLIL